MFRGTTQLRRRHGSESEPDSYVVQQSNGYSRSNHGDNMMSPMGNGGPPSSSSSRDRTNEFMSTVRSLQGRQLNGQRPLVPRSPNEQLMRQSGEFMKIARAIGRDIASTFTKLEKLTLLAKRKTIFDDRPQEIQELTYIIKEDMNALNRQIAQLQQIARSQSSSGQGKHQKSHSSSVVVALQSKLASMTTDFKQVLEVRTENLKESKSRQEQFSSGAVSNSMPPSAVRGFHTGSVLAMEDDMQQQQNGQVAIPMDGAMQSFMQDQTDDYLQSRASTMQNIESTIVELGQIFTQLATMVKEQEEIMVRIDSNVEDAALNVEAGHGEILKYFQSVTSNRWLMVKIFGVLIFFFIFFVIFMA